MFQNPINPNYPRGINLPKLIPFPLKCLGYRCYIRDWPFCANKRMRFPRMKMQESQTVKEGGPQTRGNSMQATAPAVFLPGTHNLCWHQSLEIFPDTGERWILGLSPASPPPGVLYNQLQQFPYFHFPGHQPPDSEKLESYSFL